MRIVGRGHADVRATHDKTLEFTADPSITARATCVLAVGAALPDAPLAGPVRLTVTCAGESFAFEARAVSSWRPGGSLVVRRSLARTPNTFAVAATATAADLPRGLVDALRDPGAEVVLTVERRPSAPTLVIAGSGLAPPALAAERDAEDEHRRLVVTDEPLPRVPHAADEMVETVGLHPAAAAVAVAPWPGPVTVATEDALAATPARHLLLVPTRDVPALLAAAARTRGTTHAVLAAADHDPVLHELGTPPPRLGGEVWCCLAPASESSALDPPVRAAVEALLVDGVPTKSVAKALAALTQQPQRDAYDVVLGLRASARPT